MSWNGFRAMPLKDPPQRPRDVLRALEHVCVAFRNIVEAIYNIALSPIRVWLDWLVGPTRPKTKESLMRFIYYGGSHEAVFALSLFCTYG
jgi:hypothetical protein